MVCGPPGRSVAACLVCAGAASTVCLACQVALVGGTARVRFRVGFFGGTCYWVGLTIVGWTGSQIGWLAWLGLTFVLAGYYAAWAALARWLYGRTTGGARVVSIAAAWVLMEWARTVGSLTMPWQQLSYTQFANVPVLQFCDLTGAYGLSFLLMLCNVSLAEWYTARGLPQSSRWLWSSLTLGGMVWLFGLARMQQPEPGSPIRAAAMQSNFSVRESLSDIPVNLDIFSRMSAEAASARSRPDLILWSESAAPGDALYYEPTRRTIAGLASAERIPLLVGSRVSEPETGVDANSSLLFAPSGEVQRYDKQQLVPFGEFIPFRKYIPAAVARSFGFFDRDVRRGDRPAVFRIPTASGQQARIGPFICYESMYPDYARAAVRAGANVLVTQSNDAWFQSTAAMEQHLAAVVLRAVENRRWIIRSTTSGVTCFVDTNGRVTARAPLRRRAVLNAEARLTVGQSFYARFGDWFVDLCAAIVVICGFVIPRIRARADTTVDKERA